MSLLNRGANARAAGSNGYTVPDYVATRYICDPALGRRILDLALKHGAKKDSTIEAMEKHCTIQ